MVIVIVSIIFDSDFVASLDARTKKNDVLNSLKRMSNACQKSWQRI